MNLTPVNQAIKAAYHARLGASSSHRWLACSASPGASDGKPNEGSDAARDGTIGHAVAEQCLLTGAEPEDFLGRKFAFCVSLDGKERFEDFADVLGVADDAMMDAIFGKPIETRAGKLRLEHLIEVDAETVGFVRQGIEFVNEQRELLGGELLVEQDVPIGHITGEPGATGQLDVALLQPRVLNVMDFKFGRMPVTAYEVVVPERPDPIGGEMLPPVLEPNPQIAIYADGALEKYGLLYEFDTVRLVIIQPPLNNVSEFTLSVADLRAFIERVRAGAEATRTNPKFVPGDHCTFCRARVGCKARDELALTTALEGFDDVNDAAQIASAPVRRFDGNMAGALYGKVTMIRKWCDDVIERTTGMLNRGEPVINEHGIPYKLVAGRNGARFWLNPAQVEEMLRDRMRLRKDEMYHFKLISPADAEEMAKVRRPTAKNPNPPAPILGERQWTTLQELIGQNPGKPQIALATDPRPAVASATDGFDDVSQPPADEVDLFN